MKQICVLGAGNIGATLARKLAAAGHSVRIANSRGPETLKEIAEKTGATAMTMRDATQHAHVVIMSVPFGSIPLLRWLLSVLPREVVVADTSNYFPYRDGPIAAVDAGEVESLWVSEQVGRPIIKAWNNALAATLTNKGRSRGTAGRVALSVAGDELTAKKVVMSLVEETGFDAIDAGALAESWRQQPITRAYCTELPADELREALVSVHRERVLERRDALMKLFTSRGDELTTAEIVRLNRTMGA